MKQTRTVFATMAAAAIASQLSCGPSQPEQRSGLAAVATRAAGSSNCFATGPFTVLEVGTFDQGANKKVAEGCWWQQRPELIHGFVDESLGWELCNSCDVDVDFKLSDVPSEALTGCTVTFDASNTATKMVLRRKTDFIYCYGLHELNRDDYVAAARDAAQTTGQYRDSDPEIEIEDRHTASFVARLAVTSGITECLVKSSAATGPTRLTISGNFAPMRPGAYVVLIPAGGSPLDGVGGGDLVEIAPRQGEAVPQSQKPQKFSVSSDLPAFVTSFVLRDKSGLNATLAARTIGIQSLQACK